MRVRNKAMGYLGFEATNSRDIDFRSGGKFGFFDIYEVSSQHVVLGKKDRHLNFSLTFKLDDSSARDAALEVSTCVRFAESGFNRFFGRSYFAMVRPFHEKIMKSGLEHLTMAATSGRLSEDQP